jgi:hypothetical protein
MLDDLSFVMNPKQPEPSFHDRILGSVSKSMLALNESIIDIKEH